MLQLSRIPRTTLCLVAALAAGSAAVAHGEDLTVQPDSTLQPPRQSGDYADPMRQWLDDVKAQRQAWEARRQATKEAINARRRLNDPWGAAQKEAREKENQRRHDAILEQVERNREAFRNQGPWQDPSRWEPGPPPPGYSAQPDTVHQLDPLAPGSTALNPPYSAQDPAQDSTQHPDEPNAYSPSGWDNRWYYRGY